MYRDNTLIPTEAIRLAALGFLAATPARYADVARDVRQFASRITGPSLDMLGTSIELLRFEGLVEPVEGRGMEDNALLEITEAGRGELRTLLTSSVRTPVDGVNKLVLALKMRYLHLLSPDDRREQFDMLIEASEAELARLEDLANRHGGEQGYLAAWNQHDIAQVRSRIDWLTGLRDAA